MFIIKEVEEVFDEFLKTALEPNKLDKKTIELIAVSNSIMADCAPCIEYHYKGAIAAGCSKEEIAQAIAVALSICSGSKRAKYAGIIQKIGN